MKRLLAFVTLVLPILLAMGLTSSTRAIAQDREFELSTTTDGGIFNGSGWTSCKLKDAGDATKTSGEFQNHAGTLQGWTWTKDGNDYVVRDGGGNLMFTMDEAANSNNTTGACVDNPGTSGDYGGTWTKK